MCAGQSSVEIPCLQKPKRNKEKKKEEKKEKHIIFSDSLILTSYLLNDITYLLKKILLLLRKSYILYFVDCLVNVTYFCVARRTLVNPGCPELK